MSYKEDNLIYQNAWQLRFGKLPWDYFTTTTYETKVSENHVRGVFDYLHKNDNITHLVWVQECTPEKLPMVLCTFRVRDREKLTKDKLKEMLENQGPTEIWEVNTSIQQNMFKLMFEDYPGNDRFNVLGDI